MVFTDTIILKKAEKTAGNLRLKGFKKLSVCLKKFKKRSCLSLKSMVEEGKSADSDLNVVDEFIRFVKEKIDKYGQDNIYNADETGLFYKQMPTKTMANKIRQGVKNYKDRVSLLLCYNMSGRDKKLPIMI